MLIKSDLQQIGNVVDDKLKPVKKDLTDVKKDLTDVKKRVRNIEKTVDVMAGLFDAEDVRLAKRVSIIEKHLALPEEN